MINACPVCFGVPGPSLPASRRSQVTNRLLQGRVVMVSLSCRDPALHNQTIRRASSEDQCAVWAARSILSANRRNCCAVDTLPSSAANSSAPPIIAEAAKMRARTGPSGSALIAARRCLIAKLTAPFSSSAITPARSLNALIAWSPLGLILLWHQLRHAGPQQHGLSDLHMRAALGSPPHLAPAPQRARRGAARLHPVTSGECQRGSKLRPPDARWWLYRIDALRFDAAISGLVDQRLLTVWRSHNVGLHRFLRR